MRVEGIAPYIAHRGQPHGSGLGTVRWVVEQSTARLQCTGYPDRPVWMVAWVLFERFVQWDESLLQSEDGRLGAVGEV